MMFVCIKPENRGLTSVAPKKATPTIVVTKSKKPIKISGKQKSALLLIRYFNND